jgi:sodium/potassium-transporting ATPase subunit alpha
VESGLSPLQKEITRTTSVIAFLATTIGLVFFVIGHFIGRLFWENFIFAIGVIVALVPEGMLPTVTLALAMASQRMAKRKALIKTLTSVETLGSVSVICTDKTGTLTQNRMSASKMWTEGRIMEAKDYRPQAKDMLMQAALLCNNARFADNEYKGDPTETALLKLGRESRGDISAERISEIPFDSDRKRMTTVTGLKIRSLRRRHGKIPPLCRSCRQKEQ